MGQIFDDTKVVSFHPKREKDKETGEVFDKLILKGEAKLDNSLQITELFAGFRKRLIAANFSPYDNYDNNIDLKDVCIEDFTVKTRMERVGQGKDAERIPVECVQFTMTVKMDVEGNYLKDLYSIFNRTVKMEIE